jgi:hypothetical protein
VLSSTPSSLFDFEPTRLIGKHAVAFLDVLQKIGAPT